jgi:anaerobic ribonucleoside-triphosphate reductase activating protein
MEIVIDHIQSRSFVDGPGERMVLFLRGCPIHCPGCQNAHLWNPNGGNITDTADLATTLKTISESTSRRAITISGGEPFAQTKALAYLLRDLKSYGFEDIIVYTGYTWDQIISQMSGAWLWAMEALRYIDTLVDGPFIHGQDHNLINWRGSANQRPINVKASLENITDGRIVVRNWDAPEIIITQSGEALMPIGLSAAFTGLGEASDTRRCGQTR